MPFDPNNPPEKVGKLSAKKQRQFVHVFNSCWEKHHDDAKCHKMAWGAVRKASCPCEDGREVEKHSVVGIGAIMSDKDAARGLFMAMVDIDAADRIAMSLFDEVKIVKLKSRVVEFLHRLGDFRGEMSSFINDLRDSVRNPKSLQAFPEIKDILAVGEAMRHVNLSTHDVQSRIVKVVTVDAAS